MAFVPYRSAIKQNFEVTPGHPISEHVETSFGPSSHSSSNENRKQCLWARVILHSKFLNYRYTHLSLVECNQITNFIDAYNTTVSPTPVFKVRHRISTKQAHSVRSVIRWRNMSV